MTPADYPVDSAQPVVSVVIGVYNGERHLRECVDSVLDQSFRDFELILIDDASTDASWEILESYSDARIVRLRNEQNIGLTRSLNRGLETARGRYVARLDADDVAEPERLAKQVAHMEAHPEIVVLGTWTTEIDEEGRAVGSHEVDPAHDSLLWEMTHRNPIYHPTAMLRSAAIHALGGYDEGMRFAQDHELWTRVVMAGGRVEVLPERLVRYRRGEGQISSTHNEEQVRLGWEVRRRYAEWLLGKPVSIGQVDAMMRVLGWGDLRRGDLRSGLALAQRIRRTCRRSAGRKVRRRIDARIREALLANARKHSGDMPRAAFALSAAGLFGTGARGWMRPTHWGDVLRLCAAAAATGAQAR